MHVRVCRRISCFCKLQISVQPSTCSLAERTWPLQCSAWQQHNRAKLLSSRRRHKAFPSRDLSSLSSPPLSADCIPRSCESFRKQRLVAAAGTAPDHRKPAFRAQGCGLVRQMALLCSLLLALSSVTNGSAGIPLPPFCLALASHAVLHRVGWVVDVLFVQICAGHSQCPEARASRSKRCRHFSRPQRSCKRPFREDTGGGSQPQRSVVTFLSHALWERPAPRRGVHPQQQMNAT
jgi:hypothetical protein